MAVLQVNPAARSQTVPAAESVRVLRGNALFRPEYRLRRTDEFSSVFALRRTQRSRHFVIHHGPSGSEGARLGVVVAKRHLKHAHSRNLIKRLAREAFRHARPGLKAFDIVLRLNMRPQSLDRPVLRAELDALLGRLRRQDEAPLTESAR